MPSFHKAPLAEENRRGDPIIRRSQPQESTVRHRGVLGKFLSGSFKGISNAANDNSDKNSTMGTSSKFSEAAGNITWREYSRQVQGESSRYDEAEGNIFRKEYSCQVIQNKQKTSASQSSASARLCFKVSKLI